MGKHTPEPWKLAPAEHTSPDCFYVTDETGKFAIARVFDYKLGGGMPNARRIVACVNVCAGIPTGRLEGGAADVLEHAQRLLKQRDELLASMRLILDEPKNTMSDGKALREIVRIARAAVASIEKDIA